MDFTADALAVVKDRGARLSEQEGALFLPALVDKCGHPMEAVREKFRRIVRLVPGVFPASKVAGYLVRGLDSKNTKTRLEVLDVMGSLMERHGLDVVERAGNRALAEVAKLADQARDVGMRSAALACLVTAYKVGGDDAWRHLGRLSDSLRDALEEKFAKAAREMERRNEGLPGGWTRGVEKPSGSPIAAMASAVFRPVQAMVSTVSSVLPGRRQHATSGPAPEPAPEEEREEEEEEPPEREEPPPMEVRLAGWTRSLDSVASVSDAVAVAGMKSMCHEVMAAVGARWQPYPASAVIEKTLGLFTDPSQTEYARTSKMVIDATRQLPGEGGKEVFPKSNRELLLEMAPDSFERVDEFYLDALMNWDQV